MGQVKSTVFSDDDLDEYQELTYLTKIEILRAYEKFNALVSPDQKNIKNPVMSYDTVMNISELKVNPFRDRIFRAFASSENEMTFEDFLDMISVFNEKASKTVKTEYVFRIYDFDEDDFLSINDIKTVIDRLTGRNEFSKEDIKEIIDNVMAEADLDGDNKLNYSEFEHIIHKLPDFETNFRIRL